MITVHITDNPLEPNDIETHQVENITAFLRSRYGNRHQGALRIYHMEGQTAHDVTPMPHASRGEAIRQISRLHALPGPFLVRNHPTGPETWIYAVVAVLAVSAAMLLRPKVPNLTQRQRQQESPNNQLSARTNEIRLGGRIPDIYGEVWAVPDMIAVPINVYENHVQKEICYMCLGVGTYEVNSANVQDGSTPVLEIPGTSVEIYGPNTSPNSGDAPQLRIGNPINQPIYNWQRTDSVNGQVLQANDSGGIYRGPMIFRSPNIIERQDPNIDFTEHFIAGDTITVEYAAQSAGTFSHSGTWQVEYTANPSNVREGVGTMTCAGNLTADWSIGQSITISQSSIAYVIDGGESGYYTNYANLDGIYELANIEFIPADPFDPESVDSTKFTFNNPAERRIDWTQLVGSIGNGGAGFATFTRPAGAVQFDLSGVYTINTLTANQIFLNAPNVVNPDWDVMEDDYGGVSQVLNPNLFTNAERWAGWFTVQSNDNIKHVISNVLAVNGLYGDNGNNQYAISVDVLFEARPVDINNNPIGATESFTGTVQGSAISTRNRALTMRMELSQNSSRWQFRQRRTTPTFQTQDAQIVDEIQWSDLYAASDIGMSHFGDVTTVATMTVGNTQALSVKDRKINMLSTRKIPVRQADGSFTSDLVATKKSADIIVAISRDPYIGRRQLSDLDLDSIYGAYDDIVSYFGTPKAGEFCYTFDKANMSYEDTINSVTDAIFCEGYRRGSKLQLYFEKQTDLSVLILNHRNTLPQDSTRSVRFGNPDKNDGVEYQWVDPVDDAVVTLYLPADRSALNPLKIESVGVRNNVQAHFHAWRYYNKLRQQHRNASRDVTREAYLLVRKNRVLVAINRNSRITDGDVLDVDGLTLTLSQPVDWSNGTNHFIFLQNTDGQVENMPIYPGDEIDQVILDRAPRTPVQGDGPNVVNTTYIITSDNGDSKPRPYLVDSKTPKTGLIVNVTLIEYKDSYYANDIDFINGIVQ